MKGGNISLIEYTDKRKLLSIENKLIRKFGGVSYTNNREALKDNRTPFRFGVQLILIIGGGTVSLSSSFIINSKIIVHHFFDFTLYK